MRIRRALRRTSQGQALVEFALAATLIFMLLSAAVDLGLIFFTLQGLNNAAQEGATYGSRWLITDPTSGARLLNRPAIRDRVRHEAGSKGGIGFVNLLDLNNNGVADIVPDETYGTQETEDGEAVVEKYIKIEALRDRNGDGDPLNDGTLTACDDPSTQLNCYIRVSVSYNYKMVFPLAPVFGNNVQLHSQYVVPMRDSFRRRGY